MGDIGVPGLSAAAGLGTAPLAAARAVLRLGTGDDESDCNRPQRWHSGPQANARARARPPRARLLDYHLPGGHARRARSKREVSGRWRMACREDGCTGDTDRAQRWAPLASQRFL